ncbi:unnamed protein product [Tetraodon nigroviridis]|uniref:Flotillin n=1 Tax=Tetraodon nigroviridis TaxID=99883 RepID=Q4RIU6_TETNG|nr:unnamed protein product [Tetraodon nigroviridis]
MFYTCGPNEAMVVSGKVPALPLIVSILPHRRSVKAPGLSSPAGLCRSPPLMIAGGRVFVIPCIQKIQRISLNTLTLNVKSDKVYTRHGVPISVTGIAQMKIQGQNKQMLAAACQMFMGKSEGEIAHIALETLEGHQRAIIAHLTVEEIYKDRKKFSEQVFQVASSDLVNMGISVVSYTLKDVHDDQDYLHSLGKARTAQVQKDARIGEAKNKRDAVIREAHAMQEKVSAQYKNEIYMAKAQRDYELKKAAYDIEVNMKKAESEMAYQLQVAKTRQRIEQEKMQVLVVERTQQITLQEQEITRRERAGSQGDEACRGREMKGEAEAFAVEAKGRAEAEQMTKKAEAFQQYKDGAMVDMLLEKLPLIAEEISKPLCAAHKVTMVSSGDGQVGAAKLSGEVLDMMSRIPEALEKLTGVSISQMENAMFLNKAKEQLGPEKAGAPSFPHSSASSTSSPHYPTAVLAIPGSVEAGAGVRVVPKQEGSGPSAGGGGGGGGSTSGSASLSVVGGHLHQSHTSQNITVVPVPSTGIMTAAGLVITTPQGTLVPTASTQSFVTGPHTATTMIVSALHPSNTDKKEDIAMPPAVVMPTPSKRGRKSKQMMGRVSGVLPPGSDALILAHLTASGQVRLANVPCVCFCTYNYVCNTESHHFNITLPSITLLTPTTSRMMKTITRIKMAPSPTGSRRLVIVHAHLRSTKKQKLTFFSFYFCLAAIRDRLFWSVETV